MFNDLILIHSTFRQLHIPQRVKIKSFPWPTHPYVRRPHLLYLPFHSTTDIQPSYSSSKVPRMLPTQSLHTCSSYLELSPWRYSTSLHHHFWVFAQMSLSRQGLSLPTLHKITTPPLPPGLPIAFYFLLSVPFYHLILHFAYLFIYYLNLYHRHTKMQVLSGRDLCMLYFWICSIAIINNKPSVIFE